MRRQALGIINILISSNYHMPLIKILAGALYLLNIKPEDTGKLIPQILEFFKLRLKNMMIEQGIRYDVVDASPRLKVATILSILSLMPTIRPIVPFGSSSPAKRGR